jgi:hypothetical protein
VWDTGAKRIYHIDLMNSPVADKFLVLAPWVAEIASRYV